MNIFFDVDCTIIAYDGSLRPHVREVFEKLKEDGHTLFIWSGVGLRWEVVNRYKLDEFISGCYVKPLYEFRNLAALGIDIKPDICIDDYPEFTAVMGGIAIKPYPHRDPDDAEMWRVYESIAEQHRNGNGKGP